MINKYGIEEWNTKPKEHEEIWFKEESVTHYEYKKPIELLIHDLENIKNYLKNAYINNEYIDNKFWGNYLHHIALEIYN